MKTDITFEITTVEDGKEKKIQRWYCGRLDSKA